MWFSDNKLLVFTDCHHGADATEKENRKTSPCSASYVRWQRGTARIRSPLLLSAGRAASTRSTFPVSRAHSSKPATVGLLLCARAGQTDGRTPCRYIDPAQHTVRAVLTSNQLPLISRGGKKVSTPEAYIHNSFCSLFATNGAYELSQISGAQFTKYLTIYRKIILSLSS